jgi:hypothetical protein
LVNTFKIGFALTVFNVELFFIPVI